MTSRASALEQGRASSNRSRWLVPLALLAAFGTGAAVTGVIATGGGESASAASLNQVQASCRDWSDTLGPDDRADDEWCSDMFAWMSDQSGGSMMGSMMWRGAGRMGEACRAWVGEDRDLGTTGPERCDDMVGWMDGHMSSRDGMWMMDDD